MGKITVVGSINMDMVFTSDVRPAAGVTVIGTDFRTISGGKGANQAVACAKLGAETAMIGCVGNDYNGIACIENFKAIGVNTEHIDVKSDVPTGVAAIIVAESDNSIIVVAGANQLVTTELIEQSSELIRAADMVLMQLEIPMETVEYTTRLCKKLDVPVMLNPAPAVRLSRELIDMVTYLTPNEHECRIIFGRKEDDSIDDLLREYSQKLIITQGAKGVSYHDGSQIINVPSFNIKVVDTTGAGDTFNGALACGIINGLNLSDAAQFANKAAALSVTKLGAQTGMPTYDDVASF